MLSNNEKILYSGLVVVAVGIGMYLLRKPSALHDHKKVVTYQDISTERNAAIAKDRMEKVRVEVTNARTAPRLGNGIREVKDGLAENTQSIRLETEKNHAAIDAADPTVHEMPFTSLETQINRKQVDDQRAAQMSIIQKKNFVEQYKKRALAMGYRVELNDRLELVRAEKVTQPMSQFPSASKGVPVDVDSMEEDIELDEEE